MFLIEFSGFCRFSADCDKKNFWPSLLIKLCFSSSTSLRLMVSFGIFKFSDNSDRLIFGNLIFFLEKLSILLSVHDWFGSSISRGDIELYFKQYYTIFWNRYFKLQIPFLVRWKTIFGDLESFVIWGNMGINQNINLERIIKEADIKSNNSEIENEQYIANIINMADAEVNKSMHGINASSIAEISSIPRATVIRKLNKLSKKKIIKRNKKLEYLLTGHGTFNEKIKANYLINQKNIALFITDVFSLIKKSSLKI